MKQLYIGKKLRPAFTIIEILISVIIISGSIIYALKIHSENHKHIVYLSERNKLSLQDSLFLGRETIRYHKSKKNAHDVIQRYFKVEDQKSRALLKKAFREYYIPERITILPPPEIGGYTALVDEIKIKGIYSSYYFHFKLR